MLNIFSGVLKYVLFLEYKYILIFVFRVFSAFIMNQTVNIYIKIIQMLVSKLFIFNGHTRSKEG